MPTEYCIIVKGHLADHWSTWFDGLTISNRPNGETMLSGRLEDQAALHGVLVKLRDLGVPLIALQPVPATQPDGSLSQSWATEESAPEGGNTNGGQSLIMSDDDH